MSERKPGYYWIKYYDFVREKAESWEIGYFTAEGEWLFTGDDQSIQEHRLAEICEQEIKEPKEVLSDGA